MVATIEYRRPQNLGGLSLDSLVSVINSYGKLSERTPIEHIQELRKRRGVSGQDAQKIHQALLKAYNVEHGYRTAIKPAVIATIRGLAKRNKSFRKEDLQQWVGMSLDIIDDGSIDADEVLQGAAIAFVREQWDLVLLCKKDNLQICIANDDKEFSEKHENLQAKVIKKCIGFINNSCPFVCSASVALVHEKWEQLTSNQENDVLDKCIQLMDRSPDEISAALSLLRDYLPKDDQRRNDIANKAGEFLSEPNDTKIMTSAALFVIDHIKNSKINKDDRNKKLRMFFDLFREKKDLAPVTAIFHAALQVQAGGTTYSQTQIATQPSATNGHRPARAAQPHQPATNPAAFARPAPLSR